MNLLVFNLATDEAHVTLAFSVRWICEIARYFDHVDVVTMQAGSYSVPSNVSVWSVGREHGYSRIRRVCNFYRILRNILVRRTVDVVFTHIATIFAILFWPISRVARIPNVMFYAHGSTGLILRVAHRVVNQVLTSTPEGFRLPSRKVLFIGQGVDTEMFTMGDQRQPSCFRILSVGRIAPIKRLDTLAEALENWCGPGKPWILTLIGDVTCEAERLYRDRFVARVRALHDQGRVEFLGRLDPAEIAEWMRRADVFLNLSRTGSLDKAIVEAMASGCPVLSSNEAFSAIAFREGLETCVVGEELESVRTGLDRIAQLSFTERTQLSMQLRMVAVRDHSLNSLIGRIVGVLHDAARNRLGSAHARANCPLG